MKHPIWTVICLCSFLGCGSVQALELLGEGAVGAWLQSPEGRLSYQPLSPEDRLDVEDDLDYGDETGLTARLRIDLPGFFPGVYLMYTGIDFQDTGMKNVSFTFGGETFEGETQFDSEVNLDHFDVAVFGSIPFLRTATAGMFAIDLGVNGRIYLVEAEVEQNETGLRESVSFTLPIPMLFAAAQFRPIDSFSLEAEFRGITYQDDRAFSILGRARYTLWQGIFIAGGYRYDDIDFDEEGVDVDVTVQGPFLEAGFAF
jgi:outer membrane protein